MPDRPAARKVRRALASGGALCGVVAGTWPELVDQANRAYLVSPIAGDWDVHLAEAARKITDPFWSGSLDADPEGTIATISRELRRLIEAVGPGGEIRPAGKSAVSDRGKRHLVDLSRLHDAMLRLLPDHLAAIRALLAADGSDATRTVAVYYKEGFPAISPWQRVLLDKLATDSGGARDAGLDAALADALAPAPAGKAKSALGHIQRNLFGGGAPQVDPDDSVACLAVRDDLEAAEVAAGMIQKALATDPRLAASDVALLLTADGSCDEEVREVFRRAGLPVSGLEGPPLLRNLGGEAVFHFLATRRRPAPVMALAALYSSPLMPWDEATGNRLAMEIMDGEYDPEGPADLSAEGRRMMKLARGKYEAPGPLKEALEEFTALLNPPEAMARHADVARDAARSLVELLRKTKGKDVPWEELAALVPQRLVTADAASDLTREGVAVFREDEEPWRPVRLLFVLGFAEGRYPAGPARSPVFDQTDTVCLKRDLGYVIESADEGMQRRRELLLRQLRVVADRVVFLAPLRDAMGDELAPSGTAAFIGRLLKGIQAPEEIFLTLERDSHRSRAAGLALAPPKDPAPPRDIEIRNPDLQTDLLAGTDGKLRSLTPSGLETLMVSPLGWLFDRMDVAPLAWAPETLDPPTKGTLAHEVFEKLFLPGSALPVAGKIKSAVEELLSDAMLRRAPFLLGSEWYVERRNLLREIETAAVRWREFLDRTGAKILGVEIALQGMLDGVPIRGRTDTLLSLTAARLFVVDHKKSTSTARRKCMENGYDIQTSLYRQMLRTGTVVDGAGEALAQALKGGAEIGVLYYMMDDQRALTDTSGWIPRTVSGVQELGGDISGSGEALVRERIGSLRAGIVPLNREDDEDRFQDVGVKTYALDKSPLIRRFMHSAPEDEEGE